MASVSSNPKQIAEANPVLHLVPNSDVLYSLQGYTEYIEYAVNTPKHKNCRFEESQTKGNEDWFGTSSFEEAEKLARFGWDAGIDNLSDLLELDANRITVYPDLVGAIVDVPRYLSGIPDNMLTFIDETNRNKPILKVYVQLNYNCGVSGDTGFKYTRKVLETIALLNQSFNVELIGGFFNRIQGHKTAHMVIIKGADERLVFNSLAFAFHPSFFRRFKFRMVETISLWCSSYGSSIHDIRGSEGRPWRDLCTSLDSVQEKHIFLPNVYDMEKNKFVPETEYQNAIELFQNTGEILRV